MASPGNLLASPGICPSFAWDFAGFAMDLWYGGDPQQNATLIRCVSCSLIKYLEGGREGGREGEREREREGGVDPPSAHGQTTSPYSGKAERNDHMLQCVTRSALGPGASNVITHVV